MNKRQIMICAVSALMLAFGGQRLQAQENAEGTACRGELGVSLYAPSVASMPFTGHSDWETKTGSSFGFGADYTHWFNEHVGLTGGLRFTMLINKQRLETANMAFQGVHNVVGFGVTGVKMLAQGVTIQEEQTLSFLEIPVQVSLTKNNWYLNLGASLALGLSAASNYDYDIEAYNITAVPALGIALPAPVPATLDNHREGETGSGKLKRPVYGLLNAEVGYRFNFDDQNAVTLGLYGRYGINKCKLEEDNDPITLDKNKVNVQAPALTSLVEKVGYYEVGLRITYHYGFNKKK